MKKDMVFWRMAAIGLGVFIIAALILFSFSSDEAAKRYEERAGQLADENFKLKLNLSIQLDKVEALDKMLEGYSKGAVQGLALPDHTEQGGEADQGYLDSDGDGLMDSVDAHPEAAAAYSREYTWQYAGKTNTLKLNINRDWYEYYLNKKRATTKEHYLTPSDPLIVDIANEIQKAIDNNNYKSKAEFVMSFVQNMEYVDDNTTKGQPYPRYPIETLWDGKGDCEDFTYLAASILKDLNVDIVLLDIPGHLVVGVNCANCDGAYWEHNGKKYYYIESTATGYKLGDLPEQYEQWRGRTITIRDV